MNKSDTRIQPSQRRDGLKALNNFHPYNISPIQKPNEEDCFTPEDAFKKRYLNEERNHEFDNQTPQDQGNNVVGVSTYNVSL